MGTPSVPNSFTNGTTASAIEVNANFASVINALTDGSSDHAISTLTLSSTLTCNGNVVLGSDTSDSVTINGDIASNIVPDADETYSLGSTAKGWAGIYLADNSQYVAIVPSASASASWTLTLPPATGTKGQFLKDSDGAGTATWDWPQGSTSAKSGNYTITDTDGIDIILMTTGSGTNKTVTLPTAADNAGRTLIIKKVDSGTKYCIVDGEGAETVEGIATIELTQQYSTLKIVSDGTEWHRLNPKQSFSATYTSDDTWTAPKGVTVVTVEGYGGGGAGGVGSSSGGAGGAGSMLMTYEYVVTGGTGYTVTVGAGGPGDGGAGDTGSDSAFGDLRFRGAPGGAANSGTDTVALLTSNSSYHYGGGQDTAGGDALNANYTGGAKGGSGVQYGGGGGAGPGGNGAAGGTADNGDNAAANTGAGGGGGSSVGGGDGGDGGSGKVTVYWEE